MALNGSVKTNAYDGRYYLVDWTATQDVASNISTITWTLRAVGGGSSWYAERTLNVNIAGDNVFSKTARVERKAGTITSGTVQIEHGESGGATFNISLEVAVYTSAINCTGSANFVLNTIPRATEPIVSASSADMGQAITISMPRANSTFTHTLKFSFGGSSNTIASNLGTSYTWTVPLNFANRIPKATSGVVTLSCLTYSGSTLIGTKTVQFTVNVPASMVPVINEVTVEETVAGIASKFGAFIQDHSGLKVTIDAEGIYSSTITTYSTALLGTNYTGSSFKVEPITTGGELTLSVTVKDSRGRTATLQKKITVLPYISPNIGYLTATRCDDDGVPDDEGYNLLIEYNFSISTLNNKNDKSYTLEMKSSSESSYSSVDSGNVYTETGSTIETANIDDSYLVKLTVSDYFKSATYEIEAPTGFTLVDYHSSGRGIAFFKVSERERAMEIGAPIYDEYDTRIGNGLASYASGGSIDANTTLEACFISNVNTPDESLWNVQQIFYDEKSETASRVQVAIPYAYASQGAKVNHTKSNFRRSYIPGINMGWTEWYREPILIESGTSGVWRYEKWSDSRLRVSGKIPVNGLDVTTALGSWFRSGTVYNSTTHIFPIAFAEVPVFSIQYIPSNSNGAVIWTVTNGTITTPPNIYLIRPVSGTGLTGYVHIQAEGYF